MPRRLLRDGEVVADEWRLPAEGPSDDAALMLPLARVARRARALACAFGTARGDSGALPTMSESSWPTFPA